MHRPTTKHFLDLLVGMSEKELRARYKNTVFGFLWVFVNPLLQMLVIGFIFRLFIKDFIPNYSLYLLAGLLTWNFFSLSLTKTTPSIINERALIKKAAFPRIVIPLSIILSNFINLILAFLLVLIPVFLLKTASSFWFVSLLLGLLLLLVVTVGFSLLAAALNVKYRDVNFFVQAVLMLWFYATPIVYSVSVIPKKLIWFWMVNPLTSVIQLFQSSFTGAPLPDIKLLAINIVVMVIVLCLGIIVFRNEAKNFDDWV